VISSFDECELFFEAGLIPTEPGTKTPNIKIQTPKKLQFLKPFEILVFGDSLVFGAWMLVFIVGVF